VRKSFALMAAVCCCLLLAATQGLALDLSQLKPQGYVSDFAKVVDNPSRESINRYLAALEKATGAQVALVTIQTLEGEPIEQVANQLYRQWGVGKKETNEGVLFLFAIKERRSRLEVGYGLEPVLPDGAAGGILRGMRPALRAGNYSEAFLEAARQLGARLAGAKGVIIDEALPGRRAMRSEGRGLEQIPTPWLVVGGIVLLFLVARAFSGGRRRYGGGPWISTGGFGGGFGGSSGGGGSSWGGFGGGDSGGGGASSDW
jgi:uncharacterized protein